jgi:hypothetical protein
MYQSGRKLVKNLFALAVTALMLSVSQANANPYGKSGFAPNDDYTNVQTTNWAGDEMNISQMKFFNRQLNIVSAVIKRNFPTNCEASKKGKNKDGQNLYEVSSSFEFPNDPDANTDIGKHSVIVADPSSKAKASAVVILINQGAMFIQAQTLASIDGKDRTNLVLTDNCGKKQTFKFNTTGDWRTLLADLPRLKEQKINSEVDKEFE